MLTIKTSAHHRWTPAAWHRAGFVIFTHTATEPQSHTSPLRLRSLFSCGGGGRCLDFTVYYELEQIRRSAFLDQHYCSSQCLIFRYVGDFELKCLISVNFCLN